VRDRDIDDVLKRAAGISGSRSGLPLIASRHRIGGGLRPVTLPPPWFRQAPWWWGGRCGGRAALLTPRDSEMNAN
jgi:hypothetical protein